jgi:hypothetical protein
MNERRSFEDALWDGISVALGTSANIDAAFDKKVLLLCRMFRVDKKKCLQLPLIGAYIFFAIRAPAYLAAKSLSLDACHRTPHASSFLTPSTSQSSQPTKSSCTCKLFLRSSTFSCAFPLMCAYS